MDKLIITAAICGAEVTKEQNPTVPYTVEEIVREAKSAVDAGAAIVHLHVRWDDGTPTQSRDRFQECTEAILKVCILSSRDKRKHSAELPPMKKASAPCSIFQSISRSIASSLTRSSAVKGVTVAGITPPISVRLISFSLSSHHYLSSGFLPR